MFKRPYSWEDLSLLNVRLNEAIDHGCNWNDVYVPYSDLENVVHCEASSAVVICFGPLKTEFISSLINLRLLISLSWDALRLLTYICLPSAAHSHVISQNVFCVANSLFISSMATFLHY